MNRRAISFAILGAVLLAHSYVFATEPIEVARASATAWLKTLDAADYPATWRTASEAFKAAIAADAWGQAAKAARSPLGQVKSRAERSATFRRTLPGAPDGEYIVIQFETAFEKKAQAVETITATHEPDGNWRIGGYFVK